MHEIEGDDIQRMPNAPYEDDDNDHEDEEEEDAVNVPHGTCNEHAAGLEQETVSSCALFTLEMTMTSSRQMGDGRECAVGSWRREEEESNLIILKRQVHLAVAWRRRSAAPTHAISTK
jgi:hypothetical protein